MHDLIAAIQRRLQAPSNPVGRCVLDGNHRSIRPEFDYPRDYIEFMSIYGAGIFCDMYDLYSPCDIEVHRRADTMHHKLSQLARGVAKEFDDHRFDSVYLDHDGLLLFGRTTWGDLMWWRTSHVRSDDWNVVVTQGHGDSLYEYRGSFSSFLIDILDGRIDSFFAPCPEDFDLSYVAFTDAYRV